MSAADGFPFGKQPHTFVGDGLPRLAAISTPGLGPEVVTGATPPADVSFVRRISPRLFRRSAPFERFDRWSGTPLSGCLEVPLASPRSPADDVRSGIPHREEPRPPAEAKLRINNRYVSGDRNEATLREHCVAQDVLAVHRGWSPTAFAPGSCTWNASVRT